MPSLQLRIEIAFDNGRKCGLARKQKDEARARSHKDWFGRWLAEQPDMDKTQLRQAFDNGYSAEATPPVTYFK